MKTATRRQHIKNQKGTQKSTKRMIALLALLAMLITLLLGNAISYAEEGPSDPVVVGSGTDTPNGASESGAAGNSGETGGSGEEIFIDPAGATEAEATSGAAAPPATWFSI